MPNPSIGFQTSRKAANEADALKTLTRLKIEVVPEAGIEPATKGL